MLKPSNMSLSVLDYLYHIRDECDYLIEESIDLTDSAFFDNRTLRRAFVRSLEIIGEATKQLPDTLRQAHSTIEWRSIAGMRDRLIHAYFGVDYELVWDVVVNKVPDLRAEIEVMIAEIRDTER